MLVYLFSRETCILDKEVSWDLIDRKFSFPFHELEKEEIYNYVDKYAGEILDVEK